MEGAGRIPDGKNRRQVKERPNERETQAVRSDNPYSDTGRPRQQRGRPDRSDARDAASYFSFQVSLSAYTSSRGELIMSWTFRDIPTVSLVASR